MNNSALNKSIGELLKGNGGQLNMAISYLKNKETIYKGHFGNRNREEDLPFETKTLNHIGSCSKSFTALAILLLEHSNELSISDSIPQYLPVLENDPYNKINISHLLSHSSGFPDLGPIFSGTWDEFYNFINNATTEIINPPGKKFYYFNFGYTLLAKIIEVTSGKTYENYVRRSIYQPLKMEESTFITKDDTYKGNYSSLHLQHSPLTQKPLTIRPHYEFIIGPGGIVSNVDDMSNYLLMMMNSGKIFGEQIFPSDLIEKLTTDHIMQTFSSKKNKYGYGWENERILNDTLSFHTGGALGTYSIMGFLKNSRIGFVAISNKSNIPNDEIIGGLALVQKENLMKKIPNLQKKFHYEKLSGRYEIYAGRIEVKIVHKNSKLILTSNLPEYGELLIPENEDPMNLEFFYLHPTRGKIFATFVNRGQDQYDLIINNHIFHQK